MCIPLGTSDHTPFLEEKNVMRLELNVMTIIWQTIACVHMVYTCHIWHEIVCVKLCFKLVSIKCLCVYIVCLSWWFVYLHCMSVMMVCVSTLHVCPDGLCVYIVCLSWWSVCLHCMSVLMVCVSTLYVCPDGLSNGHEKLNPVNEARMVLRLKHISRSSNYLRKKL